MIVEDGIGMEKVWKPKTTIFTMQNSGYMKRNDLEHGKKAKSFIASWMRKKDFKPLKSTSDNTFHPDPLLARPRGATFVAGWWKIK